MFEIFPWHKLAKFLVTGGTALLVDMGIYFICTRYFGFHYLLSRVVSLAVAIVWNYSINRYWTFEAGAGKISRQFPRFLTVITLTSMLNLVLMRIGVEYLKLNDLLVILIVSGLIALINFSAHFLWSYANERKASEPQDATELSAPTKIR